MDLASGRVAGNPIGACIQNPGYDVTRLSHDVLYDGNGRSLDTRRSPCPIARPAAAAVNAAHGGAATRPVRTRVATAEAMALVADARSSSAERESAATPSR